MTEAGFIPAADAASIPTGDAAATGAQWESVAGEVTALVAQRLEPVLQKVRDDVYDTLLTTVQDYLCDNLGFNIAARLQAAERGRRNEWIRAEERSARVAELEADARTLKCDVIAFCTPHAARYPIDFGLPDGHLHPVHYDILDRCGARMDDFTRATDAANASDALGGDAEGVNP